MFNLRYEKPQKVLRKSKLKLASQLPANSPASSTSRKIKEAKVERKRLLSARYRNQKLNNSQTVSLL